MSRPLTKVYVGKFGKGVARREIEDLFGKYGDIYDLRLNEREGYAVIAFRHSDEAERAIQKLNGSNSLGGNLLVEHTFKKGRFDYETGGPDSRHP